MIETFVSTIHQAYYTLDVATFVFSYSVSVNAQARIVYRANTCCLLLGNLTSQQLNHAVLCHPTVIVGVGLRFRSRAFSKDVNVQHLIFLGIPFVAVTQPINSLAFDFDGVNFGALDFAYTAYIMVWASVITIASLFILSKNDDFVECIYSGFGLRYYHCLITLLSKSNGFVEI